MRIIITALILLFFFPVCYGEESAGKICLNIPQKGVESVKIENNCQKGDIIQLNKIHIALLCDFNSAIVSYIGADQYICVYLGKKRGLRDGTNYGP
jgi:hypothetical protein